MLLRAWPFDMQHAKSTLIVPVSCTANYECTSFGHVWLEHMVALALVSSLPTMPSKWHTQCRECGLVGMPGDISRRGLCAPCRADFLKEKGGEGGVKRRRSWFQPPSESARQKRRVRLQLERGASAELDAVPSTTSRSEVVLGCIP